MYLIQSNPNSENIFIAKQDRKISRNANKTSYE